MAKILSPPVSSSDQNFDTQKKRYDYFLIHRNKDLDFFNKKFKISQRSLYRWNKKARDLAKTSLDDDKIKVKDVKKTIEQTGATPPKHKSLPSYIDEIIRVQSEFVNRELPCSVKDAIYVKEQSDKFSNRLSIPPWTRPQYHDEDGELRERMSPKQHLIIDAIADKSIKVVFVDGEKRTGKSTCGFLGICECIWNGTQLRWGFWAKTEKLAMKIHRDIKNDPISVASTQPLYKGKGSALRTLFFNGGLFEVNATSNPNSISGQAYEGVWIDEMHSVLKDNPRTFAMIAMILRSEPNIKILLTANQGGIAFQELKNKLSEVLDETQIAFFSLTKDDVPHITDESDALVRIFVETSAGDDMAAQFLDNAVIREDGLYYPDDDVEICAKPYKIPNMEQFDRIGCGVDWGDSHDTAITVWGFLDNQGYELETTYKQHPNDVWLLQIFTRICRDYPGVEFVWEASALGALIRNMLRQRFPRQRFIDSYYTKRKSKYIDNLYVWIVDHDLHIKDGKLKRQLKYFKNDKKNDDGHDALCHLMMKLQPERTTMRSSPRLIQSSI